MTPASGCARPSGEIVISELVARLGPLDPPASEGAIVAAESALRVRFPDDYKAFLRLTNGFENFTPNHGRYLALNPVEALAELQPPSDPRDRQSLLWIGGDGGGEGFCFDLKT